MPENGPFPAAPAPVGNPLEPAPSATAELRAAVQSAEKHYFGFDMDPLAEVLTHYRCEARRCGQQACWLLRYAYVRQRDRQPTYVTEPACEAHARVFADDWGLS